MKIIPFQTAYLTSVHQLVSDTFGTHIAPLYSKTGIEQFHRYIDPHAMAQRLLDNHRIWCAISKAGSRLAGMIETRDRTHISLFFVAADYQRKGVGRNLLKTVIMDLTGRPGSAGSNHSVGQSGPGITTDPVEITVHASPNAVPAYNRFGFAATGPGVTRQGIRFIPMKLALFR